MRVVFQIEYRGENYVGWQVQKNGVSVQQVLSEAYFKLTGEDVTFFGSGRTDAGVSAYGQMAHIDTNTPIPSERLYLALNTFLPSDIRAISSKRVSDDFDARKSAKRKTYVYKMYQSPIPRPILDETHLQVNGLNLKEMKKGARLLCGKHDFSAFCSAGSGAKTTERIVYSAKFKKCGDEILFYITGNGFLYNMVRICVGTLIEIGLGKKEKSCILKAFSEKDRSVLGKTAPAKALYLLNVEYNP